MATAAYTNGYQPIQFADFAGGLNLRDKADAVGDREAIDLLNVDFANRGAIHQRIGYGDWIIDELPARPTHLASFHRTGHEFDMVVCSDQRVDVIVPFSVTVPSQTGLGPGPWTTVATGQSLTNAEKLWLANGVNPILAWDGTAFTSGAAAATVNGTAGRAMPRGKIVLMTAALPGAVAANNAGNRLISTGFGTDLAGGPGGAVTNPSRAWLSNMNAPTVWETDGYPGDALAGIKPRGNYHVDFTPGDGQYVDAGATWRELVFIFKQTKYFVLWGEAVAPDTTSYFQVREVVNNVGIAGPNALAVGRDGVYFLNYRGVYQTTGGDPKLISDAITPMWAHDLDVYFESEAINLSRLDLVRMWWHQERLYVAVPTGDRTYCDRTLVYDTQHEWWSLYDTPMAAITAGRTSQGEQLFFAYSTGPQLIGGLYADTERDRGQRMVSRWRSGFGDYNSPQQKTFRETKIWGSGAFIVGFSTDFQPDLHYAPEVVIPGTTKWPADPIGTWNDWLASTNGTWPRSGDTRLVDDALVRRAVRGTVFSTQFTNAPSVDSWSVHRVSRHLREIREPSIR